MSQVYGAALLAAHGYPALTVAYFDWPGLPPALDGIPLEYFETAGKILASQPQVDPAHVLAMGYSRGSEAALLLADDFPHSSTGRSCTRRHRRSTRPGMTKRGPRGYSAPGSSTRDRST